MEVIRSIQCRGCGASGKAGWDTNTWNEGIRPTSVPLSVSGDFYFHKMSGIRTGKRIACAKCHQFFTPE